MATRPEYEAKLRALLAAYDLAQRIISQQIAAALNAGKLNQAAERARQFNVIAQLIRNLGDQTDPLARILVADAYRQSDDEARRELERIGVETRTLGISGGTFNAVQRDAVDQLASAIVDRLSIARRTIGRQVEDVFAEAGRREVMLGLLGANGSRRAVSRSLVTTLRERGITGFVDRAGRRWKLTTYAEMAVRTTTREAVVQGAVQRFAAQGVSLIRISRHANPCSICAPLEGRIMSLDGRTGTISGLDVSTLQLPPFHPRCRHTVQPVVPSLANVQPEAA